MLTNGTAAWPLRTQNQPTEAVDERRRTAKVLWIQVTVHSGLWYAFHGENFGIVPFDGFTLKLHKGEIYKVVDKDSVDLFGFDLTKEIIDIENKSQLIAKAPSIIEKLKQISGISGYPYYGNPNQEPQYIIIKSPPEIVNVPTESSGRNVFISGGSIDRNHGMKAILQV